MDDNDTTLEVVRDDHGSAAWRECGPGGCTTSRQRLDEKTCNAARAALEVLVAYAMASVGTAPRWTLPIGWEGKRRKRRARGRQIEARRMVLGQLSEASDDV